MTKTKIFLFFLLLAGLCSIQAQRNDDYRLKALTFFCQHREELVGIENPVIFKDYTPVFFLDIRMAGDDNEPVFFIDSTKYANDTIIKHYLFNQQMYFDKYLLVKTNDIPINYKVGLPNMLSKMCDCIYIDPLLYSYMDIDTSLVDNNSCKREYSLHISKVMTYNDNKYVMILINSFFKGLADKSQFFLIEFSKQNGNEILKCWISRVWNS